MLPYCWGTAQTYIPATHLYCLSFAIAHSPAWCYCCGGALVRIPDNILMATLWTVMVYWSVGFYASAGQ
jgi:hypothetical protein